MYTAAHHTSLREETGYFHNQPIMFIFFSITLIWVIRIFLFALQQYECGHSYHARIFLLSSPGRFFSQQLLTMLSYGVSCALAFSPCLFLFIPKFPCRLLRQTLLLFLSRWLVFFLFFLNHQCFTRYSQTLFSFNSISRSRSTWSV